jgi:dihydroxyacetone kinase-like predicted kinase
VVEGDFAVVGHDLFETGATVVDRLLVGGGELVTLVRGEGEADGLAERLHQYVEQRYTGVDVAVFDGGQARYPLLIGVE